MDFYHAVFFDPHLCSLLSKYAGVAGFSDAVLPYLILTVPEMHHYIWQPSYCNCHGELSTATPQERRYNFTSAELRLSQSTKKRELQQGDPFHF